MIATTPSDYQYGIEKMFNIVDLDSRSVPFVLNPPQKRINQELSNMSIILKARQEGISSLIGARFLIDWLTQENIHCAIISHEDRTTKRLFDRVKFFLESTSKIWPDEKPFDLKINSRHEMVNEKKNSTFYIGSAGARAFGRGDTINDLHISELSYWMEQEKLMTGLLQAVPKDGNIIVESTANGIGDYFYKMCVKAREGLSPFKLHFIPWFELPLYSMPVTTPLELLPQEQELINRYGLSREQIVWRRWKINQMGGDWQDPSTWDKFNQEFPDTIDAAFIVSGNTVWSPQLLRFYLSRCKEPVLTGDLQGSNPVSVALNSKGFLKVFKEPNEFHTYAIGADPAEGKMVEEGKREGDFSCIQVFDKVTYEQVAVWHGRIYPDKFGRELDLLGRYYNDALIGVERNAVGVTPLVVLRDLNYPNLYYRETFGHATERTTSELGWVTSRDNKESLISDTTALLRDHKITLYDDQTLSEMMSFIRDSDGRARAARSSYDDRVMSAMIAIKMLSKVRVSSMANEIEKSDYDNGGFYFQGQSFDKRGMPIHPDELGNDDVYSGDEF